MRTNKQRLYEGPGGNGRGGSSGGGAFNGERPITRNTPGIKDVNLHTNSIKDTLEALLYPQIGPQAVLTIDNPVREVGASKNYTLSWQAIKTTNPITGITIDGNAVVPTGNTQNGDQAGAVDTAAGTYFKALHVTDGAFTTDASCTLTYLARMFWGTIAKNGTTQPITDADVLALTGSELRADRLKSFVNFGGGSTRLIFAIPTSYGTPQFVINGLVNTAFTLVRGNSDFVNGPGATVKMDIWVSDNLYNSPLDTVKIN